MDKCAGFFQAATRRFEVEDFAKDILAVVSEKFSKKSGHGISEGGDKTKPLNPKGTMTRKETKRSSRDIKALMSQEEDALSGFRKSEPRITRWLRRMCSSDTFSILTTPATTVEDHSVARGFRVYPSI